MRAALLLTCAALALAACGKTASKVETPAPVAAATPAAPKVTVAALDKLPAPLPLPYDDAKDLTAVNADLDKAFADAKASGKRVLVNYGGNWCSWCRGLEGVMTLPEVKPFIDQNFVVVHVSTGKTSKEMNSRPDTYRRFAVDHIDGTPYLVVAEADGTVLHRGSEVTDDQHETPQAMVDWLAQWAKPSQKAAS